MDEELLKRQMQLQQEGQQVLTELGLLDILIKIGTPEIVGSLATGLMTWRDIDIEVQKTPVESEMWEIANFLFSNRNVRSVNVADYRYRLDTPFFPKGLYLGVKYQKEEGKQWKIDIWLMEPRPVGKESTHLWLMERVRHMSEAERLTILKLKDAIADHPKYRREIFSMDIYKAVFEASVQDLEGFRQFLAQTKRTL
jgi:hypothetical protein